MATLDSSHQQLATIQFPPAVPALLALVAGYVDVATFLAFNGLFVAQATGSLVVAGAALETGEAAFLKVAAIPVFLVAGILTTYEVRLFGDGKPRAFAATLLLEAALIGCMVLTNVPTPHNATAGPLFGLAAMGVQSAVARLMLSSYGATNVMTSNLTQLSIDLETVAAGYLHGETQPEALRGIERLGLVLATFTLGVVLGGISFTLIGMSGLTLMIAVLIGMAAWVIAVQQRLNRVGEGSQNG